VWSLKKARARKLAARPLAVPPTPSWPSVTAHCGAMASRAANCGAVAAVVARGGAAASVATVVVASQTFTTEPSNAASGAAWQAVMAV
jgi:hypothetical protein